jgi:hypothetical protein
VIAAKERRIVDAFRDAGATSPSVARTAQDVGIYEDIGFKRLRRHEVIREANPGFFYLDEPVWSAVRRTRRRLVAVLLVIVMFLIVSGGMASGFFVTR